MDIVNHPKHYQTPSGIECIHVIESLGIGADFCRGNAIKYLFRLGSKGCAIEDAKKARWYVDRLIQQLEKSHGQNPKETIDRPRPSIL